MKLKKVEIKGFKSFAFKTEIKIKEGITAIVGPNGSGKSNISDAIRWVLGEQSIKNLRGSRMEDVIFAGTSTRKPLGYCEVTITFDNKDGIIPLEYNEVEVTRRMFRSGESQYYLNKSICRLKDIKEIFMDTGVGKDGYSIIGQGRIEEILSNKPEDRRSIFEEAAGIVKYKSKKNEAERKLEKTENNIIRIKDLVHELSKQRDTLEEQADKAKEFNEIYSELKNLEVALLATDIKKNKHQLEEISKEKAELERELNNILKEEQSIGEKVNILKKDIKEFESQIELSRKENADLINKCDKNRNELAITKQKEVFYQKDLKRLIEESQKTNIKLDEIASLNRELSKEIENEMEKHKKVIGIYEDIKTRSKQESSHLIEKEKEIENRKNNIINIYNQASDIKSKLNSIVSFNENIKKRIERLNKDINEFTMQKCQNEVLIKKEIDKKNISLQVSQRVKDNLTDKEDRLSEENKKLVDVNEDISKINMDKQSKSSSLKLLKSMEEDYEGYYKGVKSVLKQSKNNLNIGNGLIGVVAEMIKVSKKYERAIEISLGSNGQNLVTENEHNAKNIIEYLKKNKLGRVTCLPLNVIKGRELSISEVEKKEFNILGLGHEVIEYDKRYENIFKYLLGRTIIIDNIERAIAFAKKSKHNYRIVTLDGEIINPGGSMTGGSHGGSSINIINRKNRIEDLEYDIKEIELNIDIIKKKQSQYILNIKKVENEVFNLQEKIKENEFNIYGINNNIANYKDEQIRIENLIQKSKRELLELYNEEEDYKIQDEKLNMMLLEVEKSSLLEKDEIKTLMADYNLEKEKKEERLKYLTDIKLDINEIENKIRNLQEKQNNIEITKRDLLKELEEKNLSIKLNQTDMQNTKSMKEQLDISIERLDCEQRKMEKGLSELLVIKDEKMDQFYLQQENLTTANKSISLKEKKINSIDIKLAKISTELRNYENRLLEEYELKFQEVANDLEEVKDVKNSIIKIRRLKSSIKELGNVNLGSIEEYKVLSSRLKFILNQQKDLIEAKENLNNIILNMESKMKKQFLLNFEKINHNFIEIFKVLFNGGKAELILEDEDDILNTGIQINAQPPGKKLQNLTLLSGGEKSLTAVALLFSILNLRPAPFCILDEIDASLDEANISKYTSYLKNFSSDTQFVLITHRKTTMEIADNLYGVTMEEDGISKLISVKLTDYVNEIAS